MQNNLPQTIAYMLFNLSKTSPITMKLYDHPPIHKSPLLKANLSKFIPIHTVASYKVHFNIIATSHTWPSSHGVS
jgi:hypothetical protein